MVVWTALHSITRRYLTTPQLGWEFWMLFYLGDIESKP